MNIPQSIPRKKRTSKKAQFAGLKSFLSDFLKNKPVEYPKHSHWIVRKKHKDWPNPTQWRYGQSLADAEAILGCVSESHREEGVLYYIATGEILATTSDGSLAAALAVQAWEESGRSPDIKIIQAYADSYRLGINNN